jgi:hypothetical protein
MIKEIYIGTELSVRSRDTFLQYRSDDAILIGVDHHWVYNVPHPFASQVFRARQTMESYFRATERFDWAFTMGKWSLLLWSWQACPSKIICTEESERYRTDTAKIETCSDVPFVTTLVKWQCVRNLQLNSESDSEEKWAKASSVSTPSPPTPLSLSLSFSVSKNGFRNGIFWFHNINIHAS